MHTRYIFDSLKQGKHLLIIGGIHGNEPCGSDAIEILREKLLSGEIPLESGKITAVTRANFDAYKKNVRGVDDNLNRIFGNNRIDGEARFARAIEPLILEADFVLDLHSFFTGVDPFVFNDFENPELNAIIENLPIRYIVNGWCDLYDATDEMDTIGFAKKHNTLGVTVECGAHTDVNGKKIGFDCIISVLSSLGIIQKDISKIPQKWIQMTEIIRKTEAGDFEKPWNNFDKIKK